MLGTHVKYIDPNGKEHLAIVTVENDDSSVLSVFVYDFAKVVENLNNVSNTHCFHEIKKNDEPVQLPLKQD